MSNCNIFWELIKVRIGVIYFFLILLYIFPDSAMNKTEFIKGRK